MTKFEAKKGYFRNFWKYTGLFHLLYLASAELFRYLRDDPRNIYYLSLPLLITLTTIISYGWDRWLHQFIFLDDQQKIQLIYFSFFIQKSIIIDYRDFQYLFGKENSKKGFVMKISYNNNKIVTISPSYYWPEETIRRIKFELSARQITPQNEK